MSLIVETGAGIQGAESYASVAFITAYWAARPHNALAAVWAAITPASKMEGCAREASTYLDANWGAYYRGVRAGYVQGLQFPRTGANDAAGYPLPSLPTELQAAVAELAVRASTSPLASDIDTGARVKSLRKKVGPLEKETEYFDPGYAAPKTSYGVVADLLAPILNGTQPGASAASWNWA